MLNWFVANLIINAGNFASLFLCYIFRITLFVNRWKIRRFCRLDIDDVDQPRYIIAVAQEKHFGRAVRHVLLPTNFIRKYKKLEDELNTRIFERKSNQIALTVVGERLAKQAQLIVEESNKMRIILDQGRDPIFVLFVLVLFLRLGLICSQKSPE